MCTAPWPRKTRIRGSRSHGMGGEQSLCAPPARVLLLTDLNPWSIHVLSSSCYCYPVHHSPSSQDDAASFDMVLLQLDGSLGRPVNTALNVSCHPQHSSCPKAACDASCVLSLAAPDDDLPRPPLSLTLVFDLGSHSADFCRWAVEAAVNLVDLMGPNDKVGIVAFSAQVR